MANSFDIDPFELSHRNCQINVSGDLVVRDAFRSLLSAPSGYEFVAGFSLKSPNTGDTWHYLFERQISTSLVTLKVYDEQLNVIKTLSVGPVSSKRVHVYVASISSPTTANLELLITSPHFNSIYGIVGGGLQIAETVASVNPNTTAVDVPNGVCVGVNGRIIIGRGRNLFISDAKKPRTYVGVNIGGLHGVIYSIHDLQGGTVGVVTDKGTWILPADAFFSGQTAQAVFQKLSDYSATDYGQTAVVDDRLFGLSENGIREITADSEEYSLAEEIVPRELARPIETTNFRKLRMFADGRGPLISQKDALCQFDLPREFFCWQTVADGYDFELVSVLFEADGTPLYVVGSEVLRQIGNTEWTGEKVKGVVFGRVKTKARESLVARHLLVSSDSPGAMSGSIRGEDEMAVATPQEGALFETAVWDGFDLEEKEIVSKRLDFNVRSDDLNVEVSFDYPGTRIGNLTLITKGPGKRRME